MSSCFLLRDGRKQACTVVPSDLQVFVYSDQAGEEVRALLDPASQQRLLRVQPPGTGAQPAAVPQEPHLTATTAQPCCCLKPAEATAGDCAPAMTATPSGHWPARSTRIKPCTPAGCPCLRCAVSPIQQVSSSPLARQYTSRPCCSVNSQSWSWHLIRSSYPQPHLESPAARNVDGHYQAGCTPHR